MDRERLERNPFRFDLRASGSGRKHVRQVTFRAPRHLTAGRGSRSFSRQGPDLLHRGTCAEVCSAMVTAQAVQEIIAAITPFIGENMARSATRVHCEKLGISDPHVTPEQVEMLITRLETGLRVFMGREKASSLMQPLRVKLGVAA